MPKKADISANAPVLLTIPPIQVSQETYNFLEKNAKGNLSEALVKWGGYFFDRQARGGMMLEPEDAQYLAGLRDGKPFRSSREIVKAVESGLNREEGQYTQTIPVDPALFEPLKEQAQVMGCSVQDILTNLINQAMTNGWAYNFSPERQLNFTERDYDVMAKFMGKPFFFGADLVKKIVDQTAEKVAA
jgi:hypothetical protein